MFKILALDGGGIRGLITAKWLEALEDELDEPVGSHFDLIAGTSTGSILAAGLAAGIPASKAVELYKERGRNIFPSAKGRLWSRAVRSIQQGVSAPKYSDKGLATELRNVFQISDKDLLFNQMKNNTIVTSYDIFNRCPVIFRSWKEKYEELKVWEIVKASCSAPTYFPAHELKIFNGPKVPLVDGGVVANNPSGVALTAARELIGEPNFNSQEILLASFGTGKCTRRFTIEEGKKWGAIEWAIPIIDVLFDGTADATEFLCAELVLESQYFRFQVELNNAYDDMDDASGTNINALSSIAMDYLNGPPRGMRRIRKLAKVLKANGS